MVFVNNLKFLRIFRLFCKRYWFLWSREKKNNDEFRSGIKIQDGCRKEVDKQKHIQLEIQKKHSCMHARMQSQDMLETRDLELKDFFGIPKQQPTAIIYLSGQVNSTIIYFCLYTKYLLKYIEIIQNIIYL